VEQFGESEAEMNGLIDGATFCLWETLDSSGSPQSDSNTASPQVYREIRAQGDQQWASRSGIKYKSTRNRDDFSTREYESICHKK